MAFFIDDYYCSIKPVLRNGLKKKLTKEYTVNLHVFLIVL